MVAETEVVNSNIAVSCLQADKKTPSDVLQFVPNICSGSSADIGPRKRREDEHIRIDDLSLYLDSMFSCPKPSAFFGVFDGHGGPEAAAYVRKNVKRFFFEDVKFPEYSELNDLYLQEVENCLRNAFLLADLAIFEDSSISSRTGTTALTALILGRFLLVANAGDCRAVLCRKGEAIDMSHDHKPTYPSEKRRVEELGGYVDEEYLNGVIAVTRALGDWEMKLPKGSAAPLIAEPELRQTILTEDDEFLVMGCDGIWDVISSQRAIGLVRYGLRKHNDPQLCAEELLREALRLETFDNLTVIVICFSSCDNQNNSRSMFRSPGSKGSLKVESLSKLKSFITH
ncbi:probable protein phosphatase 2C 47 [Chenopodium quinoa]|uniref:protein-serine/threonine phosphatase n=1 Tax=Chenopodium quinoa TaxID=63459 RepID=A0A803M0P3_CHEQI|nr:probable protein phosphatase 2C 47 [Chenopodium quinoa]